LLPARNRETPGLIAVGTAQEWDQDRTDIRTNWCDVGFYADILRERRKNPRWPVSVLVEGGSGHFDCTERMAEYFGRYIDLAAKARLSTDGSPGLKPVALEDGFLAGLPVPGHESVAVTPFLKASPTNQARPWYFNEASAQEAQAMAAINWRAESQVPAFADANGKIAPLTFRGIASQIPVRMADDGITFELRGVTLGRIPDHFVGAGATLAQAAGNPVVEWICGPVAPSGGNKFCISLDRTWPTSPVYLAVRHRGTSQVRDAVQPGGIKLERNAVGAPQKITFAPLPDVVAGTTSVPLAAKSSSGLPVRFFVRAGPARIEDSHLVFTPIPPRSKLPLAVTVAAWQWGRASEPTVQTAEIVEQTCHIRPHP
jgi:hypothetical protein